MLSNAQQNEIDWDYIHELDEFLPGASYKAACRVYATVLDDPHLTNAVVAEIGRMDRFFLLTQILHRTDLFHEWLYDRVREVEAQTDGCLDLWAREHYKSTIITFAGSIQEIIRDPEITIGIFSHNRAIAKSFLRQIKTECEQNRELIDLYPEIFWSDPKRQSPTWSMDDGLVVKRSTNPNTATVEAWGLVDSQPTAKHFRLMIYDDVVTRESVTNPEMITKTTEAWELSRHLAAQNHLDEESDRTWYIGTRYNFADTYQIMMNRQAATPRIHPATDNGLPDGHPVFLTQELWDKKKRESSAATIACQMLQNPTAGEQQEFKEEWLRRYEIRPQTLNVGILVDPANSKKKNSCNTAMAVIGYDSSGNKYLLDGACHKMSLSERWAMLKGLRNKWISQPGIQVVTIGYEKYGMQADIDHFEEMMRLEGGAFPIQEVSWTRELEQSKDDRIRRLIPDHQNWRFFYPYDGPETSLQKAAYLTGRGYLKAKPIKRKNEEGRIYDLVEWFRHNEYLFFPATTSKDFLDAMSRWYDLDMRPPQVVSESDVTPPHEGDD